jgi:tetratricopeptide (TPR) repeat protein
VRSRQRFWRLHLPLISVVLIAGLFRIWLFTAVEHQQASHFNVSQALVAIHVASRYVSLVVLPISQTIVHAVYPLTSLADPRLWTALGILAVVVAGALAAGRRDRSIPFGVAWFFVTLVPSSLLLILADRGQPMAEHRVYLATAGALLAAGSVVENLARRTATHRARRIVLAAPATVVVVLMGLTVARNRVWADPIHLWGDASAKAPLTWAARYGLAEAYRAAGNNPAAVDAYQQAIALRPSLSDGYLGLAGTWLDMGEPVKASETLRLGLLRVPDDPLLRTKLAMVEGERLGNPTEAVKLCREALAIAPALREAQDCVRRYQDRLNRSGR